MEISRHSAIGRQMRGVIMIMVLTVAPGFFWGCRRHKNTEGRKIMEIRVKKKRAELSRVPETLNIRRVTAEGTVRCGDLTIGVPRGWTIRKRPKNTREGAPELLVSAGPDVQAFTVVYEHEDSWVKSKPDEVVRSIELHGTSGTDFLSNYRSDLALFTEILESRPDQLSDDNVKAWILLHLKKNVACLEWKRADLAGATAFLAPIRRHKFLGIYADIFDKAGVLRGNLTLRFPATVPDQRALALTGELLWNLSFSNNQSSDR